MYCLEGRQKETPSLAAFIKRPQAELQIGAVNNSNHLPVTGQELFKLAISWRTLFGIPGRHTKFSDQKIHGESPFTHRCSAAGRTAALTRQLQLPDPLACSIPAHWQAVLQYQLHYRW